MALVSGPAVLVCGPALCNTGAPLRWPTPGHTDQTVPSGPLLTPSCPRLGLDGLEERGDRDCWCCKPQSQKDHMAHHTISEYSITVSNDEGYTTTSIKNDEEGDVTVESSGYHVWSW